MDTKLLDILACPICKGPLKLSADKTELISKGAGLAYPIRDGIPVMLLDEATPGPLGFGADVPDETSAGRG